MFGAAAISGKRGHINISVLETIVPEKHVKWAFFIPTSYINNIFWSCYKIWSRYDGTSRHSSIY